MMPGITLRAVEPAEFDAFIAANREFYEADMVRNGGMGHADARAKAERDHALILTAGLDTPGHSFSFIEDDTAQRVGRLWIAERPPALFVYDVFLDESARGRGIGRQATQLVEQEARRRGLDRIELNVFAGNERAAAVPIARLRRGSDLYAQTLSE